MTDPLKLSKQVAFLDRHPATTVCFHPVRVVWEDGYAKDSRFPPPHLRGNLTVDALLLMNFIQTNSVVYRRLQRYDDIPADVMPLDWYLHRTPCRPWRHRDAARHHVCLPPSFKGHVAQPGCGSTEILADSGLGACGHVRRDARPFPGRSRARETHRRNGRLDLAPDRECARRSGRAVLEETIASYPRMAELAMKYRWASRSQRLKESWRRFALVAPHAKGMVEIWPFSLQHRQPQHGGDALRPLGERYAATDARK